MEIVHCAEMPWGESLVAQRGKTDGMAHKRIFEGAEDSPDNHMLVMSQEPSSYFSPRHRHPWDQIRYCLTGKIPIAKGLYIEGGEIGYFPEGAHYGPQEGGEDRIVLLLQFGGASGQGFIGPDRLKQARLTMEQAGQFEQGVYRVETAAGPVNTDAYEAVWQHVFGQKPAYSAPAYKTPVVMLPESLGWKPGSEPGVEIRRIGVFPHRGLAIAGHRLASGASHGIDAGAAYHFLFVEEGEGEIDGQQLRRWSAVRLPPGSGATLSASSPLRLQHWRIAALG